MSHKRGAQLRQHQARRRAGVSRIGHQTALSANPDRDICPWDVLELACRLQITPLTRAQRLTGMAKIRRLLNDYYASDRASVA